MLNQDALMKGFEFGGFSVLPQRGQIRRGDEKTHVEPKVMKVLVTLAAADGAVVSRDELVAAAWDGRAMPDEPINRAISQLRAALGDSAKNPAYVETLQKLGYRVMQPIVPIETGPIAAEASSTPRGLYVLPLVVGFAAVAAIALFGFLRTANDSEPEDSINSVAVFQFECLHDVQNPREHLCFGFSEETITSLNRIESLKVIRIRQPFTHDAALNLQGAVTGSVQIIGDEIKISAQLEDSRNGHVIWSNTFAADTGRIFAVQKQVAAAIAGAIDRNFSMPAPGKRSFAAEESYSLARFLFEKRERKATLDAIEQFEEAIQLDPDYGPAYLGLAYTYIIWPDYDLAVDREAVYDRALEIVAAGIAADPGIRDAAGTVYGFVYHKRSDWVAAAEAFETAINSDTVQPIAHAWYSRALASVGRLDAAFDHAQKAMELDPGHPDQAIIISRRAITSFWLNDMETAGRYFRMASTMQLEAPVHSLAYSLFLLRTAQFAEAAAYAKLGLEQNGLDSTWIDPVFLGLQNESERQQSIDIVAQISSQSGLPETVEMTLWTLFGEIDRAMDVAHRALANRGALELEVIYIDEFAAFRQHPGFADFVDAIGLNEYWDNAGCRWIDDRISCGD